MTMSTRQIVPAFGQLRRLLARPDPAGNSDAQLLERFVQQRDESAFELLVWRHGPMVYGVCRRILRDEHDAEDAFQATLLVLARKARSIGSGESVGGWLYKVAYRVALRARDGTVRRARHEKHAATREAAADPQPGEGLARDELRLVLDEELNRLPQRHRAPVVLCYLQGLTNEEAARQLRCPVGTLKTRLARARRLLGKRLARRGLELSAGLLPAEAALPAVLVRTTVGAAALVAVGKVPAGAVSVPVACLMEGVLRAMMVMKVKLAVVVLAAGLAVAGVGTASYRALAGSPAAADQGEQDQAPSKDTPAEARVKRLRKQLGELNVELRQAEEAAAREKTVPPRKKPVAVIFGNVPITRDELADHLLARLTAAELERYVNHRILEHACRKAGITVTMAEVEAHMKAELARSGMQEDAFRAHLRKQHRTLQQWKEDVVRSRLMLDRLVGRPVPVSEQQLRDEYAAQYGEKVECQFLAWPPGRREQADRVARHPDQGPQRFTPERVTTISRHGPKELAAVAKAAFALAPGEVSPVLETSNCLILLKCKRRIKADSATRFEDVREGLKRDIEKRLANSKTVELFNHLKQAARVKLLWTPPVDSERGDEEPRRGKR
jgi:RNA polymerase sigma factor (sigma-70 family)